ncbi:MAG: energy transducer TonB [bacterium]
MNTPLVLAVVLGASLATSPYIDSTDASTWEQALEANLEHGPNSKEFLKQIVRTPNCASEPVQQLATVLLEEWSLEAEAPSLERPRLVFVPSLDEDAAARELSKQESLNLSVLVVEVAADGSVEGLEILRRTPDEKLNELVEQAFRQALFRPAREGDQYVPSTTRLHVTWPPKL